MTARVVGDVLIYALLIVCALGLLLPTYGKRKP